VIHLRVVSPPDVTARLEAMLVADPAVLNLIVLRAAVHHPDGDAVQFDVLHGAANAVVERLRALQLDDRGSIVLQNVETAISATADRVLARQQRADAFVPIWEEVEARIRAEGRFPPSWFLLLVLAGLIGAVGILTNSQILIVGAMVVGPEYGAVMGIAYGVTRRDPLRVRASATALAVGFSLAILAALLLGLGVRWAGLTPQAFSLGIRPVSRLIDTPNAFSVIVAVLAGIAGVVALAEARTSTLIGVFISVTLIPAAADMGVSLAYGQGRETWGSTLQLAANLAILVVAAIIGLPVQRAIWGRLARRAAAVAAR
jgi:uncharacterized hydrophobic protein (TIGR00271 family)